MSGSLLLTAILAMIIVLAVIAKRLRLPYPMVFVVGGLALALVPGAPALRLQPELVFLLFLPPLIFGDAWTTDVNAFYRYRKPILMLATGLVVLTSCAVAVVAHALIGLPYAVGFVLGAILSPTDAVATEAIAEDVRFDRRLATIIGGESLVNDATGLVLYRFAIAAVGSGAFSLVDASLRFIYVVAAGLGAGLGVAWLIYAAMRALRRMNLLDELLEVAISLVSPVAVYVAADLIGGSGVLAAVAGGMFMASRSNRLFSADGRIAAFSVWSLLVFVFNGAAFVLIGLQLRGVIEALGHYAPATLIGWALAVVLTLVVVRFAWVFTVSKLRRMVDKTIEATEGPPPPWPYTFALSAAGMRGIVSLAAALALPATVDGGAPFPYRDLIVFITFVAILVSLVGGGLFLPWFVRRFNLTDDDAEMQRAVALAKVATAEAAQRRLHELEQSFDTPLHWEVAGRVLDGYASQARHFRTHLDGEALPTADESLHELEARVRRSVHAAEREALEALRRAGDISAEAYRHVQWEIDLAESRL